MSATTKRLIIGGMTCPHCQARVQQALLGVPGVARAQVSYDRGTADVTLDPEKATLATLCAAIEGAGYGIHLPHGQERDHLHHGALRHAALYLLDGHDPRGDHSGRPFRKHRSKLKQKGSLKQRKPFFNASNYFSICSKKSFPASSSPTVENTRV